MSLWHCRKPPGLTLIAARGPWSPLQWARAHWAPWGWHSRPPFLKQGLESGGEWPEEGAWCWGRSSSSSGPQMADSGRGRARPGLLLRGGGGGWGWGGTREKNWRGGATGDGRHSSSSARLSSARGDDAMDDLNTEHAGRFRRLRKEISGPINCTRLALMINLSSQLILIKVNNTRGCYNPTPLKESCPEIQNERLPRIKEQINHQKWQETVTSEKIDVDCRSRCR